MDQSPTALFEGYETDLKQLLASANGKLENEAKTLKGEPRKSALRTVEMDLEEGEEIISQMEVELASIPQSMRPGYSARFKGTKLALDQGKRKLKDAQQSTNRSDLLSSSRDPAIQDDPYSDSPDGYGQRTRLLQGTERLADGQRRLEDSHRIALETENVGADIMRNLRVQREQIEHSRDVLQQADTSIDRASGTLKKMIFRMYQQRFVTGGIITILVLLILIVLYSKLFG